MPRLTAALIATTCLLASTAAARAQAPSDVQAVRAVPDAADVRDWGVGLTSTTRWLGDRAAAAVTTDTLSSWVWSVDRRLTTIALPHALTLDLAAEASYGNGGATGTMFQMLDTTVGSNELIAGVRATTRPYRFVALIARAGLGAERIDLRIAPGATGAASVDDRGWGSLATASLGTELDLINVPSVRAGVGVELGYVATSAITLHAYPSDRGAPDRSIETSYASIGHLDLHGWTLRIGGHLDF
jgi:hypothetical protein